ncbi:MAG: hypothetical protein ACQET5_02525 [Halobacteriota archaeon]|uniref:hypothetical protein n=1 Tax=Natronomonas sp. TaxID=2184060 RepID=UPI003975525D
MSVRAYLRSPVALAWTLIGSIAVGGVIAGGWRFARFVASRTMIADPAFLGGLGLILAFGLIAVAVIGVLWAVWLPCSAAIAYAVGRRLRGRPATGAETIGVVDSRIEPLYRWSKTRVAIGPIADGALTDKDVSPAEVAVGCDAFVIPALVLDTPTLPSAVERANRVVPRPGRRRLQLAGLAGTALLAALGWGVDTLVYPTIPFSTAEPAVPPIVAAALVGGVVVTAAIDTAWRVGVYVASDLDEGFSR